MGKRLFGKSAGGVPAALGLCFKLSMWTEQSRGRVAKIAKKTKRYPSDLTDEEWARIAPLMPRRGRRGRPREVEFREVINAVRYLVRSGCG